MKTKGRIIPLFKKNERTNKRTKEKKGSLIIRSWREKTTLTDLDVVPGYWR